MSPEEWAAARIVQSYEGGAIQVTDCPGAPDGTHDFDLVSTRRIALEVTRSADPRERSTRAAIGKRRWRAPELSHNWQVSVWYSAETHDVANIAMLHRHLFGLLAVLEAHSVTKVWCDGFCRRSDKAVNDAVNQLGSLGVSSILQLGQPSSGDVAAIFVGLCGGFSTGPEVVNASVEQASADNLAKLAAAEADERHLFVWVDYSAGAVELAVRLGQLPASPNLPEAVDTVWLARF